MCRSISNINKLYKAGRLLLMAVLTMAAGSAYAQNSEVLEGRVVDANGNAIVGAIVNVTEQNRIALTDGQGRFSLKNVKKGDEICVTSVGYKSTFAIADFGSDFVVKMEEDADPYLHTVAMPFGSKPKKFVTESSSTVAGTTLEKYPITVLQNGFSSTLTGVETYEWSSEPGWTESALYIRGIRSMNRNAREPLIIVDNVERDLSFLDAFPIESVTVLKDAAATAIYGMRGANGAIMVTTKRGEAGKTKVNFTQEFGFQFLSNRMENQNSYNTALTRNRARYLNNQAPLYSDEQVEMYRRVSNGEQLEGMDAYRYFDTNWFKELYREMAPMYKTNVQVSGGNDRARYYVSFSYLRQEGMWNSDYTSNPDGYSTQHVLNRYNLRSNIDIDVNKYLNVSLDLGGRIDNISQPRSGVFSIVTFGAVEANPLEPTRNPDGSIYYSETAQNPAYQLMAAGMDKNRRRSLYSTLNVTGDLSELVPGLKANVMVSFDAFDVFQQWQTASIDAWSYDYTNTSVTDVDGFTYTRRQTYSALTNPDSNERANNYTVNFNAGFHYNHTFGKHSIDARAFMRTYQLRENVREANNHTPSQLSSNRYLSWNGQATYVYDNRYIFSGNISRMGSDNFEASERWGTFWGTSLGWVASEEPWLKSKDINLLKLRASFGHVGQADVYAVGEGRYPYQSTYGSGTGYSFGTNSVWINGVAETMIGNANNRWEVSDMLNVGLDFDFWNSKLYGNIDVFKEWRSNILVDRSNTPTLLGVSVSQDSYGKAETKGVEVTLGHRNKIGKFNYFIEGMFSWNTNKITEMDETTPLEEWQRKTGNRIFDYGTSVQNLYEGSFTNQVGGWMIYQFDQWASDPNLVATSQQDAIDHPEKYPYSTFASGTQKLGTAVFKDLNGDRQIDDHDMMIAGYTIIPEITPSLTFGAEYAGFDLRCTLTAYLNRSVFLSPAMTYSGWSNNATHEVVNTWGYYTDDPNDPRNINAKYPRIMYGGFNSEDSDRDSGSYQNSIWVTNGNYLSLRNVELGYSLPLRTIAKIGMTKCRFYVSGYNLLNWSKLPDNIDPEKPMSYCWWYPKTRTFSVGVNIGF